MKQRGIGVLLEVFVLIPIYDKLKRIMLWTVYL